jgi:hypothetical protein
MYSAELNDEVFLEDIIVIVIIIIVVFIIIIIISSSSKPGLCELYSLPYKILPDLSIPGCVLV